MVCVNKFRHRGIDAGIKWGPRSIASEGELGVPQGEPLDRLGPPQGQLDRAGDAPAVAGDEAALPSAAVQLLQPSADDCCAIKCLGRGLIADPRRVV